MDLVAGLYKQNHLNAVASRAQRTADQEFNRQLDRFATDIPFGCLEPIRGAEDFDRTVLYTVEAALALTSLTRRRQSSYANDIEKRAYMQEYIQPYFEGDKYEITVDALRVAKPALSGSVDGTFILPHSNTVVRYSAATHGYDTPQSGPHLNAVSEAIRFLSHSPRQVHKQR